MTHCMNFLHRAGWLIAALFFALVMGTGCESGFSDSPSMEPDIEDDGWNEHKSPFQNEMWEAENPEPDVGYEPDPFVDETWSTPDTDTEQIHDDRLGGVEPLPDTGFEFP